MQLRIGSYQKLREYVKIYNQGALDILIIEGLAGTGKSSIVKQVVSLKPLDGSLRDDNEYCWLEGRTTAAALYERLYQNRDLPIVIDDVDGLYRDKECVNLLKCLCQTWEEKTVMWNTMTKMKGGTPPDFKTKSKVCIITNNWKSLNKHVGAVQDRGLLILFHPSAEEVHDYVQRELGKLPGIFDQEIYDFIGANLAIIADPSVRHYRNAIQLKQASLKNDSAKSIDWQEVLIESFGLNDNEMLVLKLCKEENISHNERATLFAEILGKSERTYWRVKADLEQRGMKLTSDKEVNHP